MRYLIVNLLAILSYLLIAFPVFATTGKIITVVNPVRGGDFRQTSSKPIDNVQREYDTTKKNNLSATWLIRPDAMTDASITGFLKGLPSSQEIGLFMEITPTWAKEAGVKYHQSGNWRSAGSVFLTGYSIGERHLLIDKAFSNFKKSFGYFPTAVGAWWIDAESLQYMQNKYGILANLDVSDQYTTDDYQVWGQFWSTPFYPSKRNAISPAQGVDQKIGVVTIQWAPRDPFNAYGNGVLDSTYSVQANDYTNKKYHDLNTDYFKKLLAIYLDNKYAEVHQITVGLENDFSWNDFGNEYLNQLKVVSDRQNDGAEVLTMSQFAKKYNQDFPTISPNQSVFAPDPLGSGGMVLWYQNLNYRLGWFYNSAGSIIRDLRTFSGEEPCLTKACQKLDFTTTLVRNIDEVTYGDQFIIDEGKISQVNFQKIQGGVEISYLNQGGQKRILQFLENDIVIDGHAKTVASTIADVTSNQTQEKISGKFNFSLIQKKQVILDQIKNILEFILFAIVFFYLPGLLFLKKSDLDKNIKFILSWPIGLVSFTLASFIFEYLHFKWGILFLPILFLLMNRINLILPKINWSKQFFLTIILILIGSLSWLLTSIKSGLIFDYGMGFWGPLGHDSIWHLSLIESLKAGLPPKSFVFSGVNLTNYHYFYDLLLAEISSLTQIPAVDLLFRIFPLFLSLAIGAVSYTLSKRWFKSETVANLTLFFIYFGGSFGWIISFIRDRSLGGESLFWSQQAISTLINPPFAISVLIFLVGLLLFYETTKQKNQIQSLLPPLLILWGTLIEFKVYAGVLVLTSLGLVSFVEFLKKNYYLLKITLSIFALALIVYLPNNLSGESLLIFSPFWLIHSMIDSVDRLNWTRLSLARVSGLENGNYFKFIVAEILGFIIFIVGNLGTRIVWLVSLIKFQTINCFNLFLIGFILSSILFSLLFIQKGGSFNIIQFFYYFILITNFFAAAVIEVLFNKYKRIRWIVVALVIFITIPTTWDSLNQYLPFRPPARISISELQALAFLKKQPFGVILSTNFDKRLPQRFTEPVPLFAYSSTAYVSAFTSKPEFVSDTVNLEILGVDYKGRLQTQKDIFSLREPEIIKEELKKNNIKYIYAPKIFNFNPDVGKLGLKKIFENDEVNIFQVW